jgi:hypothetical protein
VDEIEVVTVLRLSLYTGVGQRGDTRSYVAGKMEEGMRMKWRKGKRAIYLYQRS